jgi:hypothetical protein
LTVPLTTLMRLADHPGHLNGFGPIIADLARQVAEHSHPARWTYTVLDPATGRLLHHGTTGGGRQRRMPPTSRPATAPAAHPAAAYPPATPTSTTPKTGPKADPPPWTTSACSAATTID